MGKLFQSSLELSPECNSRGPGGPQGPQPRFNPHSSFRPSATGVCGCSVGPGCLWVSILTRAFARVQLKERLCTKLALKRCFNPHSSFRPSATSWRRRDTRSSWAFQSSLELSPECNPAPWPEPAVRWRFQSSLELSPECNSRGGDGLAPAHGVSILTRAFARVQPCVPGWWR